MQGKFRKLFHVRYAINQKGGNKFNSATNDDSIWQRKVEQCHTIQRQ